MIFHPDFVFAHLEKTGGTFIEKFLSRRIKDANHRPKVNRHDSLYLYKDDIEGYENIIKVGYIRNPYDWYLSFWCFSNDGKHPYSQHLYESKESKKDINVWIEQLFKLTKVIPRYIARPPTLDLSIPVKLDIGLLTFRYLTVYHHPDVFDDIENHSKYLVLNRVLKFENLTKELENFFSENLCNLSEKQLSQLYEMPNMRKTDHDHYSKYYTKEIIDLIRRKDRIIVDTYNYTF